MRKLVTDSIKRLNSIVDNRPYATVQILGRSMTGLLDSGVSVSLLGKGCREEVNQLGVPIIPYFANVNTASGNRCRIVGRLLSRITVEQKPCNSISAPIWNNPYI